MAAWAPRRPYLPGRGKESQPAAKAWNAQGRLVPRSWVNLSFISSGLVDQVLVKEGDAVAAGASLATLAGGEKATAQVAAAQLELLNAQQALDDLDRNSKVALAQAGLRLAESWKAEQRAKDKAAGLSQAGRSAAYRHCSCQYAVGQTGVG